MNFFVKKPFLFYLVCVIILTCFACEENKVPKDEELYLFPFQTQVDAINIGCGYKHYEECSDRLKRHINKNTTPISTEGLVELGKQFHKEYVHYPVVEHERSIWVINAVERMKPYLHNQSLPYDIYVVDAPFYNAFTIPGGNIYVTNFLLDTVKNEDELAYIVGHELGHNENNHTKELALLHQYVEKKTKKGTAWSILQVFLSNFTSSICGKSDELECDIASIYLLYKAGYDPEKAIDSIDLLRQFSTPKPSKKWQALLFSFLSSHPWSEDRMVCVQDYIEQSKVSAKCNEFYNNILGKVNTRRSPLNLRRYPITISKSIIEIPRGAEIEIICDCVEQKYRKNRDWLYVEYKQKNTVFRGWVDKQYVAFSL